MAAEKQHHWPELRAFVQTWPGFPVADDAQALLASERLAAQAAAEAMPDGDAKIRAWNAITQHYPRTDAAAHAVKQLDAALTAENRALFFDVKDKQARIKRIKVLTILFAGTRHQRVLKKRYRRLTEPKKEWSPWVLEREARRAKKKAQQGKRGQ